VLVTLISIFSSQIQVIGPGAISKADDGVLERVAARRIANGWGLTELKPNVTLVATEDCGLLSKVGWLAAKGKLIIIQVVDCAKRVDSWHMKKHGLLLDIADRADLDHEQGWLLFIR
jgi:hypothetical protein